jgi:transformation/transcription domain-associated protein
MIKLINQTMAFLAYVLRGHSPAAAKEHIEVFPEACVRLLRNCPPEDVGTRKELLVAIRHILSSDSRAPFIPYINTLLDERVLVGTGITSRETLRPLAYSVIADLIHHVRGELPLSQLARVIHVMSLNLNDATFNHAIQTMCAKLLNTMVESLNIKAEPAEAHRMMRSMFFTSLEKLRSLTESFERVRSITMRDKVKAREKIEGGEAVPKPETVAEEDVEMGDAAAEQSEEKRKERELEQEDRLSYGWREIEQAMPVHAVAYASDSMESFCKGTFDLSCPG